MNEARLTNKFSRQKADDSSHNLLRERMNKEKSGSDSSEEDE